MSLYSITDLKKKETKGNLGSPLAPPEKYGIVEIGIYRSDPPQPINFPFLKKLKLKTVLQLTPELPTRALSGFFEENSINHIHLGLKAWKSDNSWKPVTEELIKEALQIILNTDNHPILITCASGIHQTGTLVGCLRRLQGWSLTSTLVEYKSFGMHHNPRFGDEQFIELFDVDLVTLPKNLPSWFIEQRQMMEEEKALMKSGNVDEENV